MNFEKDSVFVTAWVRKIMNDEATVQDVPKWGNLPVVVNAVLKETAED